MIKLLIVEDEKLLREGLLEIIDFEKYPIKIVGAARNGEEAVLMIKESLPDLVLLDINIPVFNGIEVLKRTKEIDYQTIVITGYAEFDYAKEAISYGAVDYLLKPISSEQLSEAIEKVFKRLGIDISRYSNMKYSRTVRGVLEYIDSHLSENITLEKVANYLDVSKDHLNRLFKSDTGITIGQVIIKRRIELACELLEKGEKRVNEIAYSVGFKDYKYFHRVFKEVTGISPSMYKQTIQSNKFE